MDTYYAKARWLRITIFSAATEILFDRGMGYVAVRIGLNPEQGLHISGMVD